MANTFTQIHIHVVFAVQDRISVIDRLWQERLYKYMVATIQNHGHKVLAIGGMPDHVHILFGLQPTQALSDLIKDVKRGSSKWINEQKLVIGNFHWQEGYGAFSYSKSQIPLVVNYIKTQEAHHKKRSFIEEYDKILCDLGIDHNDWYVFKPLE